MARTPPEDRPPEDPDLVGTDRGRTPDAQRSGRGADDVERGPDAVTGRAGEGQVRQGRADADAIPSDEL